MALLISCPPRRCAFAATPCVQAFEATPSRALCPLPSPFDRVA